LESPGAASPAEAFEVLNLCKEHPASQVLHILAARFAKDHQLDIQQTALQEAAVYATDRSVLKSVMMQEFPIIREYTSEKKQNSLPSSESIAQIHKTIDGIDYAKEVLVDLKKLQKTKHHFEAIMEKEAARLAKQETKSKTQTKAPEKPTTRAKKAEVIVDPIIEEIKHKKKLKPSSKQKEQIEIIDQFIKTQPSISSAKNKPATTATDLTETKNDEFEEGLVSETLVEILIKQGKKDKAIEVLKKLIWKYPQKKTYFASRITELRK
jgi:tetratricopeptide (TPR) repeat protein